MWLAGILIIFAIYRFNTSLKWLPYIYTIFFLQRDLPGTLTYNYKKFPKNFKIYCNYLNVEYLSLPRLN